MAEKTGKVYLIGGGPGDPGLLTVKAKEVLATAEVVVYDRLVGEKVLDMMPLSAEKIDVGKHAGFHPVPQGDINQLLLKKALEGKRVVRLKGGDCFLFGRGGEELELLSQHGIAFEVVPGLPSPVAGTAYAGIPMTHRDCCDSVHFITGHKKNNGQLSLDYEALVKVGGTMIFMMSVATCGEIARGLMAAGMDGNMECGVIENATRPYQRRFLSTISNMEKMVQQNQVVSPALIVVGRVCRYADEFDWFGKLPLFGKKLLVTSPVPNAGKLASKLEALGADVTVASCVKTVPLEFAIPDFTDCTAAVFTSAFGVDTFFRALFAAGKDARALAGVKLAVIGSGTAEALNRYGLRADLVPQTAQGEELARAMAANGLAKGRVLLLRAKQGSAALAQILKENGAQVTEVPLYDTLPIPYEGEAPSAFRWVCFTSASAVRSFADACQASGVNVEGAKALCIGEKTAAAARMTGMEVSVSPSATLDAMVQYLREEN